MLIGIIGRARRAAHQADKDAPAGGASSTAPAAQQPAPSAPAAQEAAPAPAAGQEGDQAAPAAPAATPAAPEAAPAAPATQEAAGDEDDEEEPGELTPDETRAELDRVRRQAARYRTQRNESRAKIASLQAQLAAAQQPAQPDPAQAAESRAQLAERRAIIAEQAAEANVPIGLITSARELLQAETAEQIAGALARLKTFTAPATPGAHMPPAEPSSAPTLEQQIKTAEQSGDVRQSLRLKALQLRAIAERPGTP